tara:strand:+ start:1470 stop:2807 length:1338 start_codon:yes stop_codon:yes gene_type:complete
MDFLSNNIYGTNTTAGTLTILSATAGGTNLLLIDSTGRVYSGGTPGGSYSSLWKTGSTLTALQPNRADGSVNYATNSTIAGGHNNYIISGNTDSFIGAGYNNKIYGSFNNFIGGGMNNKSKAGFNGSFIGNGAYNYSKESQTFIGTGRNNIANGAYSSILNGKDNFTKLGSLFSFIGSGRFNSGSSFYSFIANGYRNIVTETTTKASQFSSILNGSGNTINNASGSTILGGSNYTLTDSNTTLVPKLRIANLPSGGTYSLLADSSGNVFKGATGGSGSSTFVQNGLNTYTGGTSSLPTVNISSATLSSLTVTGNTILNGLSANTISGTTFDNLKKTSFGITLDGNGGVISTGSKGFITIPYIGTITNWYITSDASGSIVVDLKRSGTSIIGGGGNKPTLSSAQRANASVSGWTSTAISANDEIEFNVDSSTTVTRINLIIYITKT